MKISEKVTETREVSYKLSPDITYRRTLVNGKKTSDNLIYTGKKIGDYTLQPIYNADISLLSITNPFWGEQRIDGVVYNKNYNWFKTELPEPEEVLENLDKIIYTQSATHCFFDLDKDPIPVVMHGDYIDAHLNDAYYKLKELRHHLLNHPNVVRCSEIEDVPYYNAGHSSGHKYLEVDVLPTKEYLKENKGKEVFIPVYLKNLAEIKVDFLGLKQFIKRDRFRY